MMPATGDPACETVGAGGNILKQTLRSRNHIAVRFRPDRLHDKRKNKLPCNVKGILNRRFKRLFGYFLFAQNVPAGSGAAEAPGRFKKKFPLAPKGREERTYHACKHQRKTFFKVIGLLSGRNQIPFGPGKKLQGYETRRDPP